MTGDQFSGLVGTAWVVQVLYAVLPLDLIPDVIPLVGWADDAGVFGVAVGITVMSWRLYQQHGDPTFGTRPALRPARARESRERHAA